MKTYLNNKTLEIFLIFFLGISVFISKSGIYISTSLITLYFAYLILSSKQKRDILKSSFISKLCISIYVIGFISCVIYPSTADDAIYFLRKGIFLLLTPALLIIINTPGKLRIITASLLISALTAILYSFYNLSEIGINNFNLQEERIESFLDIGRWSELLGYLIVFVLSFSLFSNNKRFKIFAVGLLFIAMISLLISGSRAPLLAIAITVFIFLAFNNRKLLFLTPLIIVSISYICSIYAPSIYTQVYNRVESISNTTTDHSNSARLDMWNEAISFSSYNLERNKAIFVFGTGYKNHSIEFKKYLEEKSDLISLNINNSNQFSVNDHHNAYLDNLVKMGAIYTTLYLALLLYILAYFYKKTKQNKIYSWAGINVVTAFLITGFFYTNQFSLQTIAFTVILSIPLAWFKINEDEI